MAEHKEALLNINTVSPQLLWNHLIGESISLANSRHLYLFFKKHGIPSITPEDTQLVSYVFSSYRNSSITIIDLWEIFKPRTVKFVDEIAASRQKKTVLSKCYQAHFHVTDLVVKIFEETVRFLKVS